MEVYQRDLVGLRDAVAQGALGRQEIADALIGRLEAVDGKINALVQSDFERLRARAAEMDRKAASGPLMGLPFALKDCLEVEGWVTTFGTKGFAQHVSDRSATIVKRLEAADGLLLGITNAPELGTSIETDNLLYGRTSNPIDLSRCPGGSTGGGAALVKAGAAPFVIGSDFGGGSRYTAHCCGLFAHRPSFGRVSTAGYLFGCSGMKGQMCRLAPLARSVRDLELVFSVVSGEDPDDPKTDGVTGRVRSAASQIPRIAFATGCDTAPPDGKTVDAIDAFAGALSSAFDVGKVDIDSIFREGNAIARDLFCADAGRLLGEALKTVAGTTEISQSMQFWLHCMKKRDEMRAGDFIVLMSRWETFRLNVNRILSDYDFIVIPTAPAVAPKHGETLNEDVFWNAIAYSAPLSLTASPVVVAPIGVGTEGLPVTVQIAGRADDDERLLAFCRALQETPGPAKALIDKALAVPTVFD
ncbi:MAG: amidase [Pseudomonadota bacterium]